MIIIQKTFNSKLERDVETVYPYMLLMGHNSWLTYGRHCFGVLRNFVKFVHVIHFILPKNDPGGRLGLVNHIIQFKLCSTYGNGAKEN